jgi:nucleotide-binding universal stress UspA family protein
LWNLEENKPIDNQESREWIADVVDARVEILRAAGTRVSHNIRWGDAAGMILEEAEDWKPDTIFLGARGLGRVKRFLLGSVSSAIAAKAKCSVEIVR